MIKLSIDVVKLVLSVKVIVFLHKALEHLSNAYELKSLSTLISLENL